MRKTLLFVLILVSFGLVWGCAATIPVIKTSPREIDVLVILVEDIIGPDQVTPLEYLKQGKELFISTLSQRTQIRIVGSKEEVKTEKKIGVIIIKIEKYKDPNAVVTLLTTLFASGIPGMGHIKGVVILSEDGEELATAKIDAVSGGYRPKGELFMWAMEKSAAEISKIFVH